MVLVRVKKGVGPAIGREREGHSRDRSCLLRCSLLLKARLQNWHLYFFSGADAVFLAGELLAAAATVGAISLGDAEQQGVTSSQRYADGEG